MKLNPFTGTYLSNPAEIWRELLDDGDRVRYAEDLDLWLVITHNEVRRALGDHATFKNYLTLAPIYQISPRALAVLSRLDAPPTTAAADAPTHPRTRAALRTAFATTTARVEEQYGPIVRQRVDQLTDRAATRIGTGALDLVPEFAAELPLLVILDILGVPEEHVPRIKAWSDDQIALIWGNPDEAEQVRLAEGLVDFWHYCQAMVADLIAHGVRGTDFISRALAYRNGDDTVLTEAEVASLAFNLLVAGHETTSGLLAHCLDQALSTPDCWQRIIDDPGCVPALVEEVLRTRPAIDGWLRVTSRDVVVDGVTIPAGARCLLLLGAANRDGAVFDRPDTFDPARANNTEHLSFGYGPHYCIGAALARLEAETALSTLAARLPRLRLPAGYVPEYRPNVGFRSHKSLPTQGI